MRYVIERRGPEITSEETRARSASDANVERHVEDLIRKQLLLVRGQGALAGLGLVASGASGPAAIPLAATTIVSDLASLSYFQIELSLKIAAAYGHDLTDHQARAREILHLHGFEMVAGDNLSGPLGAAGERVLKRLLMRYLRGPNLVAARELFRFVGIRFTRTGLLKAVPFVNVPAGAALADVTTRRTARKARLFYRPLAREEAS
ncbi:hypothetical protein [Actinomycetospora chlora]|uniref:hypothetical protein n=1 Tax=Actinomycetospora chlora TaxID=663608 RepID=UPI0031E61DD2